MPSDEDGENFERTVEDGEVSVPEAKAALPACIVDPETKGVYEYAQVQEDGTIELSSTPDGAEVHVVIPDDDTLEEQG